MSSADGAVYVYSTVHVWRDTMVHVCSRCNSICLQQMQRNWSAADATVHVCSRWNGICLEQMQRICLQRMQRYMSIQRYMSGETQWYMSAADATVYVCSRCNGIGLQQMQRYMSAADATVYVCSRCNGICLLRMRMLRNQTFSIIELLKP